MRRLVWLSVLAIALVVPAVGFALSASDDGTLSVKAGIGKVYLNFNGSVVGRLQRGSIQVTDPVVSDGIGFDFRGCQFVRYKSDTTTVCSGTNLRFRAIGGRYQILIRGSGIYLSAVGHGYASLDGRGEDPGIDSDGFYSVDDGPYKSLPDFGQTLSFPLAAGS
ncbi:MAG: hypothetical protein M3P15_05050 [Actinomycetota bacterium]|nr:hypothetical protein [Actinomycetota bacterium]